MNSNESRLFLRSESLLEFGCHDVLSIIILTPSLLNELFISQLHFSRPGGGGIGVAGAGNTTRIS